jgi:hypothetical protein
MPLIALVLVVILWTWHILRRRAKRKAAIFALESVLDRERPWGRKWEVGDPWI